MTKVTYTELAAGRSVPFLMGLPPAPSFFAPPLDAPRLAAPAAPAEADPSHRTHREIVAGHGDADALDRDRMEHVRQARLRLWQRLPANRRHGA